MSDERWLSKEHRDTIGGWFQQRQTNREAFENADGLLDHAEVADELIAELAEALRQQIGLHYAGWTDPGNAMTNAKNALARVDALTKDTA